MLLYCTSLTHYAHDMCATNSPDFNLPALPANTLIGSRQQVRYSALGHLAFPSILQYLMHARRAACTSSSSRTSWLL